MSNYGYMALCLQVSSQRYYKGLPGLRVRQPILTFNNINVRLTDGTAWIFAAIVLFYPSHAQLSEFLGKQAMEESG